MTFTTLSIGIEAKYLCKPIKASNIRTPRLTRRSRKKSPVHEPGANSINPRPTRNDPEAAREERRRPSTEGFLDHEFNLSIIIIH